MESICFVTNLVFGGTQVASLDLVYYVFPVLHRMASDFSIGFDWKSYKTDYQEEYYLMWKKMFLLNRNEISDIFIFYIYLRLSDSLLKPKSSSNIEKYKSALEIRNKYWAFLFPIFSYLEFKKSRFLNQTRFRFLKACFSKFYLVRSQIFCLIWSLSQ